MSIRRKIFYGFTLAVFAALLLLPATGWLARMQLFPVGQFRDHAFTFGNAREADQADAALSRLVASRPDDLALRFAHAMNRDSAASLPALEALDRQFSDNPAVLAARLSRMTSGPVHLLRADTYLLYPAADRPKAPATPVKPSDPAAVAEFLAIAARGERVAPDNAFFSAMTAAGEFARHHDAEAVAAWKRAGAKPDWDDYALIEMNARWRLQIAGNSGAETGFMNRAASSFSIMLPHFAVVHASARLATVKAVEAELAGDRAEGVALRGATRHIAAVMMSRSGIAIGSAVGRSINTVAASRAGGAEAVGSKWDGIEEGGAKVQEKANAQNEARYVAYLKSAGFPEEAAAFADASRYGDFTRKITHNGMGRTYLGVGDKTFRLMAGWYGCILLLTGALFSLCFAAVFKLIYRFSPRLQQGEPLQPSANWGVLLGVTLPALAGIAALSQAQQWGGHDPHSWLTANTLCGAVLIVAALLLVLPPITRRMTRKAVGHGLLVSAGTAAALALMNAAGAATWYMFRGPITAISLIQGAAPVYEDGSADATDFWGIGLPVVISLVMLSLPAVLLGAFALFSRMLRVPVAAGVTRGMRAMAVPLACVMILGWGVCLLSTLRHENAAIAELNRFGQIGEPRMLAERLGRPLPEMTDGLSVP